MKVTLATYPANIAQYFPPVQRCTKDYTDSKPKPGGQCSQTKHRFRITCVLKELNCSAAIEVKEEGLTISCVYFDPKAIITSLNAHLKKGKT